MTKPKALIWGYYGYYNLGDEAMLAGMVRHLRLWRPDLQPTVYSLNPTETQKRHGLPALSAVPPKRRLGPLQHSLKIHQAILEHEYFILGGGDLLRDSPEQSIAKIWLQPLQKAIYLRRKTLVWGISVGELWRSETKQAIKHTLNHTDLIVVRDRQSQKSLEDLGLKHSIYISSDLALSTIPEKSSSSFQNGFVNSKPIIAISFRDIASRSIDGQQQSHFFRKTVAQIIDGLIEFYQAKIHIIPFQSYPQPYRKSKKPLPDDYIDSLSMLDLCTYGGSVSIHDYLPSLDNFFSILEQVDLVIGTRLHSLILAAGLGKPIIGLSYDLKVKNFMSEIGQEDFCFQISRISSEKVLRKIDYILNNQDAVHRDLHLGLQSYKNQSQNGTLHLRQYFQNPKKWPGP